LKREPYDVVDAASAEGLWFALKKRLGGHRGTLYVCRSNGLEHLNYRRMLDDHAAGLLSKPWTRRIWYPASRLSQVAVAARLADRMILLNDVDREFVVARGWRTSDRVDVVPHGVSQEFLDNDPGPGARRGGGLLFCGSWDNVKGIQDLVSAFDRLHDTPSDLRLSVLGPGVPESAVLQAFPERSRHFVTVHARAPENDVMEMYRRHDVLICPSTYEGFGLVILEAMSQRLPVITTPVGCARSIVRDGQTGRLVPLRHPQAIAAAVNELMADAPQRAALGEAGRAAVGGMTWRATALRTLEVYRRGREARRAA
jgi:glycosyltransferase involved in cell wall biosynthesis